MKTSQLLSPAFDGSDLTTLDVLNESLKESVAPSKRTAEKVRLEEDETLRERVISLPRFKPLMNRPTEFFAAVQEWEGVVTAVRDDHFLANLYDVAGRRDEPTEIAEISFDDIDPADRQRVQDGAIFRWLIGHSRSRAGQFSRKWVIYFRRVSPPRPADSPYATIKVPDRLKKLQLGLLQ